MNTTQSAATTKLVIKVFKILGLLHLLWLSVPAVGHAQHWIYTVRPGDNLWNIAADYLTRLDYWSRLQVLNQVADPLHLPPGMKLRIPVAWLKAQPTAARVINVQGEAEAKVAFTGQTIGIATGLLLHGGDEIRTGPNSNVVVEFGDGSRLLVQANSLLVMDTLSVYGDTRMVDTHLRLQQGRVENQVTPQRSPNTRYEIFTPAAVSAVRGTRYRLSMNADQATARTEVLEGAVEFRGARQSRTVKNGFGALAETGKPPTAPVPLLAPPTVADLPAIVTRSPIQLSVPALKGATAYRVQIAPDEQFTTLLFDAVSTAPAIRGPDLPDGDYVLRIRGIDAKGLEGRDADHRFRLHARPEPPFLIQPADQSAVLAPALVFKWTESQNAAAYHFQLAEDERFTKLVSNVPNHTESRLTLDQTLAPGRYFWRLATHDTDGRTGPFSDPQFFRLQATPKLQAPEVTDGAMTFRWAAGLPGQQYQFQLAKDPQFETILVDQQVAEPQLTISRPESGFHYLRIRTIDTDGYVGPYSPAQRIDILPASYWPFGFTLILGLILAL
ncbi:MAG: FecR domain-containing protein [Candidatus Competibacteraceae bacterium]|nr:FecR domain-containing protein [Candidatus Competibacteraceae bacterium]